MLRLLLTTLTLVVACAGTARTATRTAMQDAPPDLAARSAGLVGCPQETIEIGDVGGTAGDGSPTEWIATCGGRSFYCSARSAAACSPVPGP